ncbi:MAG: hypothetical protein ABR569_00435 [Gaiellaceae bacterium]
MLITFASAEFEQTKQERPDESHHVVRRNIVSEVEAFADRGVFRPRDCNGLRLKTLESIGVELPFDQTLKRAKLLLITRRLSCGLQPLEFGANLARPF